MTLEVFVLMSIMPIVFYTGMRYERFYWERKYGKYEKNVVK